MNSIYDDANKEYEEFLDEFVYHPFFPYSFSFRYKNFIFQFDRKEEDIEKYQKQLIDDIPYEFIIYYKDWNNVICTCKYQSLYKLLDSITIDGLSFKEIYYSFDSEIIDISN